MLIELDDFADALNTTDPIVVHDDGPAARKCPRCLRAMRGCRLAIGKLEFEHVFACCPDDGIWFGERSLEAVLARVGRHHHRGGGGNPEQGVSSIYTRLRQPRSRPTPPAIPISGLRKRRIACPVCEGDLALVGERWACSHCAGTFVENFALESMVSEIRQSPWHVPALAGKAGSLACPVCAGTMHVDTIQRVVVDRCADHGIWFDALDLGAALRHAGGVDEPRGVAAWLRSLF
jgi:Zn-finger nucleic acid-binding protein